MCAGVLGLANLCCKVRRGGVRVHWPPRNVRQLCKFLHSFAVCGGPGRGDAAQLANSPRPRPCKACEGSPAAAPGCPQPRTARRAIAECGPRRAADIRKVQWPRRSCAILGTHRPAPRTLMWSWLVPGYWDIAAILWLEWSSLWCNRRAPLISGARC